MWPDLYSPRAELQSVTLLYSAKKTLLCELCGHARSHLSDLAGFDGEAGCVQEARTLQLAGDVLPGEAVSKCAAILVSLSTNPWSIIYHMRAA